MSVSRRSAHMNVMVETAEKAGRALLRDFGEVENLQVSKKGPADFVSTADLKSEKLIFSLLQKARPSYGFLLEEGGQIEGTDKTIRWLVDPLDGTSNFLHGIPHWCVTIALEKEGEVVAGVVYDPIRDEMFSVEKGTGAFMNNRRLQVSGRKLLQDSLVGIDSTPGHDESFAEDFKNISAQATVRLMGSAALDLAYTAAGRFDAYSCEGLHPWDVAAGGLMVKEARGKATMRDGGKDYVYGRSIVAGNPDVHTALSKTLKGKTA